MGVRFTLEHASLVGWLARFDYPFGFSDERWSDDDFDMDYFFMRRHRRYRRMGSPAFADPDDGLDGGELDNSRGAPRVKLSVLKEFLEVLPSGIVANDDRDRSALTELVAYSRRRLNRFETRDDGRIASPDNIIRSHEQSNVVVPSYEVSKILWPLKGWFDVPLYFMPLGFWGSLDDFKNSPSHTMWLLCSEDHRELSGKDFLDPFPIVQKALRATRDSKVTVCWTADGRAVTVSDRKASPRDLLEMSNGLPPSRLWRELKKIDAPQERANHILQISDLHFGSKFAGQEKVNYVKQHLIAKMKAAHAAGDKVQIVMTGDAMDSPKEKYKAAFESFNNELSTVAGVDTIIIPGNHDSKRRGFLPNFGSPAVTLPWKKVVYSVHCDAIFLCFDTSIGTVMAKGNISNEQFLEVATELSQQGLDTGHDSIMRIALTHHHPFSRSEDETDVIPFLGLKEERWLRMNNGEQLVKWCAGNRIPLILHGHKHHPRFIGQEIEADGRTVSVRAVGCGSTLGAEGKPLSYNWITLQPPTSQWTVSYFADPGDGSGFKEKRLVVG
jgi:calcineurin-like phosphoesterase family protein